MEKVGSETINCTTVVRLFPLRKGIPLDPRAMEHLLHCRCGQCWDRWAQHANKIGYNVGQPAPVMTAR